MLQRILTVAALLASVATLSDAVKVQVRIHHKNHGHGHSHSRVRAADAASSTAGSASASATVGDSGSYKFSTVTSIQARVQGGAPTWDATTKTWVASFGKTYDEQYRAVMDTVNTASVEGALMYVQAEGINQNEQSVKCQRKNKMQYIWFYEISLVQPNASLAFYGNKASTPEYCPYIAMDGGQCTPAGESFPDSCKQFDGIEGQPKLGHCVGAGEQTSDKRAPYPGNYWFSFPNSCVTKLWADKTDDCRKEFGGGLCAAGVEPDGITCSFSYKILGYLNLDDLVGITDGTYASGGTKYANYTEFCNAGNIEFSATNTGNGFDVKESIDFWKNPGDEDANSERTQTMIEKYNELAPKATVGQMTALPEVADLTKANPACYLNSVECATAKNGCKRTLYSQICEVCDSADADCKVAPASYSFPTLEYPKATSSSGSGNSSAGGKTSATPLSTSATSSAIVSLAAVAATLAAVAAL